LWERVASGRERGRIDPTPTLPFEKGRELFGMLAA
jgi:hypothetical protein